MPYTPAEAKKKYSWMSQKQAEIFSSVWNSVFKETGNESKAFAIALSKAKKQSSSSFETLVSKDVDGAIVVSVSRDSEDEDFWRVVFNQKTFGQLYNHSGKEQVNATKSLVELGAEISDVGQAVMFVVPAELVPDLFTHLNNVKEIHHIVYNEMPDELFRENELHAGKSIPPEANEARQKLIQLMGFNPRRFNRQHLNVDYFKTLDDSFIDLWVRRINDATKKDFKATASFLKKAFPNILVGGTIMQTPKTMLASMKMYLAGDEDISTSEDFHKDPSRDAPIWVSKMLRDKGFLYGREEDFVEQYQVLVIRNKKSKGYLKEVRNDIPVWVSDIKEAQKFLTTPPSAFESLADYNHSLYEERGKAKSEANAVDGLLVSYWGELTK